LKWFLHERGSGRKIASSRAPNFLTPDRNRSYNNQINKERKNMEPNQTEKQTDIKTVMIVEDDDTIRKILAIECKRKGFEVIEFRDAASAMNIIDRNKPKIDAAVVDLMNPGYGGNLGEYIKRYNEYSKTKIIYYTALTEKQFNTNILQVPDTFYVYKIPGSVKKVIEILEKT